MNRFIAWPGLLGILLLAAAGCASGPGSDLKAGERYAILYTGASRKAEGIFPVVIYNIDGQELSGDREYHRIAPGRHRIQARGVVDRQWVRGLDRDLSGSGNRPLEQVFESGVRYFIGLQASGDRGADWALVVWKTEAVSEGTLPFD